LLILKVNSRDGLRILLTTENCEYTNVTTNVVYTEVFRNV